jgi:hypothetical protein
VPVAKQKILSRRLEVPEARLLQTMPALGEVAGIVVGVVEGAGVLVRTACVACETGVSVDDVTMVPVATVHMPVEGAGVLVVRGCPASAAARGHGPASALTARTGRQDSSSGIAISTSKYGAH